MSTLASRPKRGLPPDAALARWSDPALYQELVALAATTDLPTLGVASNYIKEPQRLRQYENKRTAAEAAFQAKLADGEILASAIAELGEFREIIHPSLWDLIEVDYDFEEAVGNGRTYRKPEFFERTAIPLNIRVIPDWLDAELGASGLNVFRHSRDYRHIVLHGMEFALSPLHARVVEILHKAWLDGDPWQRGDSTLEAAGSAQLKMVDVFKSRTDWKLFIESDGKGMYRLRMDRPLGESSSP